MGWSERAAGVLTFSCHVKDAREPRAFQEEGGGCAERGSPMRRRGGWR